MAALLRTLPPRTRQYRPGRRARPTGCQVVHTAETTPDFVPPDKAAENVASFIQQRTDKGSYHEVVDSDSIVQLVEFRDEAFGDATGSNRFAIHISAATFAESWATAPDGWADATISNLAEAAARAHRWLESRGYPGTLPRRIDKEQSDNGESGFISHAERDPKRRTDPGDDFPWTRFLGEFARLTGQRLSDRPITTRKKDPFMLELFIVAAYHGARGYNPFATGRDLAGALYWVRAACEAEPLNTWTWQQCLDSHSLGVMVALLDAEAAR